MSRIIAVKNLLLTLITVFFVFFGEYRCLARLTGKEDNCEMVLVGSRTLRGHDRRLLGYKPEPTVMVERLSDIISFWAEVRQ